MSTPVQNGKAFVVAGVTLLSGVAYFTLNMHKYMAVPPDQWASDLEQGKRKDQPSSKSMWGNMDKRMKESKDS
eukprot:CAMPEP_0173422024 /NCGR_PEP_ID=MMETSP1357-20121228/2892_1 /TAXON_ID=77926 /ORGANISM="Hemiselmis rufescens, Strain PCC563" /LENGTH=72 /DNA_ID=CAMNT_0014384997 /DNA_START=193 /DNA_END=411 /DNA_ORIENTATION=+